MKNYIGTKAIKARPMTRKEYNDYRGWEMPADEDGSDEGYLVEYLDSPSDAHPDHDGYISWSPTDVFERSYRENGKLPFGAAIEALKSGRKVTRTDWNGKGMYLVLQEGSTIGPEQARGGAAKAMAEEGIDVIPIAGHIDMRNAQGVCIVGWVASQTDMLCENWLILD